METHESAPFSAASKYGKLEEGFRSRIDMYQDAWAREGIAWKVGSEIEYFIDDANAWGANAARGSMVAGQRRVIEQSDQALIRPEIDAKRKTLGPELEAFYRQKLETLYQHQLDGKGAVDPQKAAWLEERLRAVEQLSKGKRYKDLLVLKVQDMMSGDDLFFQKPLADYGKGFRAFKRLAGAVRGKNIRQEDDELDWKGEGTEDHLYDVREWGVYEMRFNPFPPDKVTANIETVFRNFSQACEEYGYNLTIKPNIHFHFSAYNQATGEDITSAKGAHAEAYRGMMNGVMQGLTDGFALYDHKHVLETPRIGASPSHHSSIRVLENRFELRCGDMIPFQPSKQIALVLGSAYQGLKFSGKQMTRGTEIRQKPIIQYKNYLQELAAESTIVEENGREYLQTSMTPVTKYDWFMTRPVIADLTGEKLSLSALPQLPTYNFKKYQPIFDVLSHLPLKKMPDGARTVDIDAIPDTVLKPEYKDKLTTIRFTETEPVLFHKGVETMPDAKTAPKAFAASHFLKDVFGSDLHQRIATEMKRPGRASKIPARIHALPREESIGSPD